MRKPRARCGLQGCSVDLDAFLNSTPVAHPQPLSKHECSTPTPSLLLATMRHSLLLLLSFLLLCGVRAVPVVEERQLLDALESFVTSAFEIDPTPTPAESDDSSPTPSPKPDPKDKDDDDDDDDDKDKDKDDDEDSTTLPTPAVRTTSTRTSETSSSEPTSSSSSSRSSSTSSTSSTSSPSPTPTQTTPSNPLNADPSPTSESNKSSGGITSAGIAVAVIMSIAIIIAVFIVVWKFHPRVVAWRRKKAYERMQERSYRPVLDDPFFQGQKSFAKEKGLGLTIHDHELAMQMDSATASRDTRPLSFFQAVAPRKRPTMKIKRKPVPTASPGGGGGLSSFAIVEMPRMEKELPARPG